MSALVAGSPTSIGFDPSRLEAAADALARKRAGQLPPEPERLSGRALQWV